MELQTCDMFHFLESILPETIREVVNRPLKEPCPRVGSAYLPLVSEGLYFKNT